MALGVNRRPAHVHVVRGSLTKSPLRPYTTLTDWFKYISALILKGLFYFESIQASTVVFLSSAAYRCREVWNVGGKILTGENRSTRRKTCPSHNLPAKNLTWSSQRSNPGLPSERAAINHVSHGTTIQLFLFITETETVYGAVRIGS